MSQVIAQTEKVFTENLRDRSLPVQSREEVFFASLSQGNLREVAEVLQRFTSAFQINIKLPVQDQVFVDPKSKIAFIEPYVPTTVEVLQDCFDPEAKLRQSVHWQHLTPLNGSVTVNEIPEFRPSAIGGAIAHTLGELALNGFRGKIEGSDREVVYTETPTIFIANSAPRDGKAKEEGAPFVYARLGYNVFYFGTNSDELTFLKEFLVGSPVALKIDECTTYRSRFLGKRAAEWRRGDLSNFGEALDVEKIPTAPRGAISYVDCFGNVKLNFRANELSKLGVKEGDIVTLSHGGFTAKAEFVSKLEDGHNGNLLIAVGSSRANFGRGIDSNSVDIYLKANHNGSSAASKLCEAFQIETRASSRHLLPLPGLVLDIAKASELS